jgi:hypothetical protein
MIFVSWPLGREMTEITKPLNIGKLERGSHRQERVPLSGTQITGSVLAAVSASVAASVFGVAGTVIGAALASFMTVVGSALYTRSLQRTKDRMRVTMDAAVQKRFGMSGIDRGRASLDDTMVSPNQLDEPQSGRLRRLSRQVWAALTPKQLVAAAALLFVVAIGSVFLIESVTGKPLQSSLTGKEHGVSGLHDPPKRPSPKAPPPTVNQTSTSDPVQTSDSGSTTPSGSPTDSGTPTETVTVTQSPDSSDSQSAGGSGSTTSGVQGSPSTVVPTTTSAPTSAPPSTVESSSPPTVSRVSP